ncbi:MAG: HAD-IIA family hydrolase [Anaerolineales bacterium]|nr:HAD-IIA family hydrolase [Anaerolineales bacterium]
MPADALRAARGFLLDLDGTVYIGERLIAGARVFFDVLRAQGKPWLFLTNNSSKDAAQYVAKLTRLGLPTTRDQVLTSGEAAADYLHGLRPGARVYVVGTPALEAEFAARGFIVTDATPDYAVLGFDTTLTYAKLWRLCDLVRAGLPYLATHPDFNCPTETGFMPDIGAMIAFVAAATGRQPDLVIGKPNRLIADAAAARLGLPVESLCMVGDRLYTDIALGPAAGMMAVLVLSGETKAEEVAQAAHPPTAVFADVGALAEYLRG